MLGSAMSLEKFAAVGRCPGQTGHRTTWPRHGNWGDGVLLRVVWPGVKVTRT